MLRNHSELSQVSRKTVVSHPFSLARVEQAKKRRAKNIRCTTCKDKVCVGRCHFQKTALT